jgi:uncharacterized protein YndB with AHSA1/START domain
MTRVETDPASTDDRACVHARRIDAPPQRVFGAFSHPHRLARWWGPKGFSSTFDQFEFRPGGAWRFVMHGPDGIDYPNQSVFLEVAPDRIVIEHLGGLHHFLLTITLSPDGSGTRVGWRQVFDTVEHRERVAPVVLEANEQNLDRLEAEVHRVP